MRPLKPNSTLAQVFTREESRRIAEGCQQLRKGMRYWKGRDGSLHSALRSHYLAARAAWSAATRFVDTPRTSAQNS